MLNFKQRRGASFSREEVAIGANKEFLSLFRFTVHWTSRITGELAKILGRVSLERTRESGKKKKERKKGERKEGKGIKGAEMEAEKARR